MLGEYRKMSLGPIEEFIFFDHPSGRTRIIAAMGWNAEYGVGEPGRNVQANLQIAVIRVVKKAISIMTRQECRVAMMSVSRWEITAHSPGNLI